MSDTIEEKETKKETGLKITIDGEEVIVNPGTTILQAARKIGKDIPTMCYQEGHKAQTSCLMCLVKVNDNPKLVTSCSRPCEDGMKVESNIDEVHEVRKTALDLMLSDHIGDCVAPCSHVCPAHMEIPQMLRQVVAGENLKALITVKRDIAFPAILGRICPEICEGGCRRGTYDTFESICLVKRYVADEDLKSGDPWIPDLAEPSGHKIVIIGSGPTGMSAAYYSLTNGHDVTIIDASEEAGGNLRYAIPEEELPRSVLDGELGILKKMGCKFQLNTRLGEGEDVTLAQLQEEYDAIFIAAGKLDDDEMKSIGIKSRRGKAVVDRNTLATNVKGVFAGGGIVKANNLAIWALAAGKTAAMSIDQYLKGEKVKGRPQRFNSKIGKMSKQDVTNLLEHNVNTLDRYHPSSAPGTDFSKKDAKGFSHKQAKDESARCLHCDCRAKDNCDLRDYSELYDAKQKRFDGLRRPIARLQEGERVHLDAGKCIQCGLCVQVAEDAGEEIGLSFEGRGFYTAIVSPLGYSLDEALTKAGVDAAAVCPTGALSVISEEPETSKNPIDLFEQKYLKT